MFFGGDSDGDGFTENEGEPISVFSSMKGSLLLNKPLTGSQYGGGNFWDASDGEFQVIKQWISEGAQNN